MELETTAWLPRTLHTSFGKMQRLRGSIGKVGNLTESPPVAEIAAFFRGLMRSAVPSAVAGRFRLGLARGLQLTGACDLSCPLCGAKFSERIWT